MIVTIIVITNFHYHSLLSLSFITIPMTYKLPRSSISMKCLSQFLWWSLKSLVPSGYVKIAIENDHWNSEFSHEKWWFSIVMLVYQRVSPYENPSWNHWNHYRPTFNLSSPSLAVLAQKVPLNVITISLSIILLNYIPITIPIITIINHNKPINHNITHSNHIIEKIWPQS